MKRTQINFVLDTLGLVCFVLMVSTGLLVRYRLPPGSGHAATLWGLDRHEWGGIHFWISLALIAMVALHLLLHWTWIIAVAMGKKATYKTGRASVALAGLVVLAAVAAAPLVTPVENMSRLEVPFVASVDEHRDHSGAEGTNVVRGSTTLGEAAQVWGHDVQELRTKLQLPATTSADERLGRLSQTYGFTMGDVREIVEEK